jgi:hypothetical protein
VYHGHTYLSEVLSSEKMSCNLNDKQNRERKDREQQMQNNRKSLLSVEFEGCESVTDVSCFRYAKVVKFHRCPNVTNVNSLKNSMWNWFSSIVMESLMYRN